MIANVKCAGKTELRRSGAWSFPPCGWKGERFPNAPRWRYWGPCNEHSGDHPEFVVKATAKPCPRCGGQVELIERQP